MDLFQELNMLNLKKNPDTSTFVYKASYNSEINTLVTKTEVTTVEKKIPSVNNLLSKTDFNTNVTEIVGKIPNIRGSATRPAVENKVSSVSNLAKMSTITEIEKKINDHKHDQYITTDETPESTTKTKTSATRIKKENLVNKTDFDAKLTNFNESINSNKLIYLLYNVWVANAICLIQIFLLYIYIHFLSHNFHYQITRFFAF